MKSPAQMSRTAILVECALMVALGFALSMIPLFPLPWGGSITCFSTLPIVMVSLRHKGGWGMATAGVYAMLQMLQGMNSIVLAKTAAAMLLCIMLDYLLAYLCIGFTGFIARRFAKPVVGLVAGISATGLLRLLCSFMSGILIWRAWAPAGMPVWWYSLSYNAGWCLPDVAIVLVAALFISRIPALHMLDSSK